MKIKEDLTLTRLAKAGIYNEKETANIVVKALQDYKIIKDGDDYQGLSIEDLQVDSVTYQRYISLLVRLSTQLRAKYASVRKFVPKLIVIGNGSCPACGGDTIVIEGDYRHTGGDGYFTPREYKTLWEEFECVKCKNRDYESD